MFVRIASLLTISPLLLSPVEGQFGVAKDRKRQGGTSFQELNEQAKRMGEAGGVAGMDQLMKQMGIDPKAMKDMMGDSDMLKDLDNLGPQLDEIMKMMAEMPPEELAKQMQDAMEMFAGDDMMAKMVSNQDEILRTLEQTGAVDAEELEKFKKDPEYFEQKMKESMDQMKEVFADPSLLETAAQGMKAAQEMYKNPDKLNDMVGDMMKGLSDEDIESVRQMFIGNDAGGDPMMKELLKSMDTKDLEDVLGDPIKWRKTVKEGLGLLNPQQNIGAGAGVGEL